MGSLGEWCVPHTLRRWRFMNCRAHEPRPPSLDGPLNNPAIGRGRTASQRPCSAKASAHVCPPPAPPGVAAFRCVQRRVRAGEGPSSGSHRHRSVCVTSFEMWAEHTCAPHICGTGAGHAPGHVRAPHCRGPPASPNQAAPLRTRACLRWSPKGPGKKSPCKNASRTGELSQRRPHSLIVQRSQTRTLVPGRRALLSPGSARGTLAWSAPSTQHGKKPSSQRTAVIGGWV